MINRIGIVIVILIVTGGICYAQTEATTAGVVERAATPQEKIPPPYQLPQIESQSQDTPEDSSTKVIVKDFVFEGNVSVPSDDLKSVAEAYLNKEITFADLKKLCRRVQSFYQLKGYFLVRVVLPPQEVKDGIIKIQVIEGSIGRIEIRGNKRISSDFINRRLNFDPAKPGVRYNGLLESLILLNEYPSFDVKTTLVKGQAPGTTDVMVDVTEHRRHTARMSIHNGGPRYVSDVIWGPQFEFYDALRTGDTINAYVMYGSPANNLRVGGVRYAVPVNRHDTKVSVGYNYSDFYAQREISDLGIRGVTQTVSLGVIHPLVRNMTTKIDLRAGFDYKDIKNYTLNNQSSHDRLRVLDLGFDHSHRDNFNGRTFVRNTLSFGIPHFLGGTDSNDPDSSRFGAGGRFTKFVVDATRVQNLPAAAILLLRGSFQLASETLPAAEEFHLGGMDTVRGYPQAEFLGDQGYFFNIELRLPPYPFAGKQVPFIKKPWKEFMQFAVFFDHGAASRKSILPGEFKDRSLSGVGLGLRFFINDDASLDMDWGFPVGGNDTSDGSDSAFYVKFNMKL